MFIEQPTDVELSPIASRVDSLTTFYKKSVLLVFIYIIALQLLKHNFWSGQVPTVLVILEMFL